MDEVAEARSGMQPRRSTSASALPYPDYANPELLERIPLSARTILDVGCAHGALGLAYARRNPRARFLGIDIDAASVAAAAPRLTEIACVDVEAEPMPFAVPEGIDCIIYGDVLEHLVDPWSLLARQTEHLAPGGTVLVCMPNVEHWSFARRLLDGSFDYAEQGLLDRTHLRWFTPRTMASALLQVGLELSDLSPRPTDTEPAERFVEAIAPGLRAMGLDPTEYLNRAAPLQFIWRARKAPPARVMLNATMLAPIGGVSDVRVVQPLRAIRTDSAMLAYVRTEPEIPPQAAGMPHIAVLHRPLLLGDSGRERIRTLLAKGYLIVTEFDDHPNFMESRGVNLDELLTFKGVHAIQTTTPALAEVLALQNPEVAMFPNGIYELPEPRNFAATEQLTLFFGALNRGEDWAPYMPVLNEVARAVGSRLQFSVVHDKNFFDALQTPHKLFTPTCDYQSYLQLLGSAEIAFMPLADNAFNRAKSDLKFIEAAASRVAALASRIAYQDTVQDQRTGLLFDDPPGMRQNLLRYLAYPEATRRIAGAARNYVGAERMLAYQVNARNDWYRQLWQRRDELNAKLRERMPGLFD